MRQLVERFLENIVDIDVAAQGNSQMVIPVTKLEIPPFHREGGGSGGLHRAQEAGFVQV